MGEIMGIEELSSEDIQKTLEDPNADLLKRQAAEEAIMRPAQHRATSNRTTEIDSFFNHNVPAGADVVRVMDGLARFEISDIENEGTRIVTYNGKLKDEAGKEREVTIVVDQSLGKAGAIDEIKLLVDGVAMENSSRAAEIGKKIATAVLYFKRGVPKHIDIIKNEQEQAELEENLKGLLR